MEPRFTMAAPNCFVTTFLANLENENGQDCEQVSNTKHTFDAIFSMKHNDLPRQAQDKPNGKATNSGGFLSVPTGDPGLWPRERGPAARNKRRQANPVDRRAV